jgi:hypothetical protein
MLVEKNSRKRAYDAVGIALFASFDTYGIKKYSFSTIFYQPKNPTD